MDDTMMPRMLDDREQAAISHVLRIATETGAGQLAEQVPHVRVYGGIITFLDVAVPSHVPKSAFAHGLLPGRFIVTDESGEYTGEILIWVAQGYLNGLEFAWVTDEPPVEWPHPDRVHFEV